MNVKKEYLTKEFLALDLDKNGNITIDELKKKYRMMARKHHPDKGGSEDKFKEINTSYQKILTYLSHFIELEEEKKEEEELGQEYHKWFESLSDKKKHNDYMMYKDYLKQKNYLKKYYGIEFAYKPFVLYFNLHFGEYIDNNHFHLSDSNFSGLELVTMDVHNKLNDMYNMIVNKWNTVSRRKKRIYRGMVRTIEHHSKPM